MKCVVTGAAGFIGSHLAERLLGLGHEVVGVDAFIPYYPAEIKQQNLAIARAHNRYTFHTLDLRTDAIGPVVAGADVVFHLAAMPGLDMGWVDFERYASCNVLATQRLLAAIRETCRPFPQIVYGSTSSVYGSFASGNEDLPLKPVSPYGVTKVAAEHLCEAYRMAFGLPFVCLRYFSVYGPRQRPDMGYHRFVKALLTGTPVTVYGDGQQIRGNTYVSDCVEATVLAVAAEPGSVYNVGGGETASVWDILKRLEALAGRPPVIRREPERRGDQRHTFADISRIRQHLGWEPRVNLDDGLAKQWEWQSAQVGVRSGS
jgi:nucleoside-diphosphate-sugar epimerase